MSQDSNIAPGASILIIDIDDSNRLRPVDPAHAALIAGSIEQKGLIQPIVARPAPQGAAKPFILIAGANRLAAMRLLGWDKLVVGETVIIRETDETSAKIDEIDENLARYDLNALDRAIFIAKRKQLYDAQRGETRGRKRKDVDFKEEEKTANMAIISSPRFSEDAANRTNLSRRVIERACQLALALDPEAIAAIRGTMLEDNQAELLQLAALPPQQQREVAARIKSGEARNVLQGKWAAGIEKQPNNDPQARILAALLEGFEKAAKPTRAKFMKSYGLVYENGAITRTGLK